MSAVEMARERGAMVGDGVVLPRGSSLNRRTTIDDHTSFSGPVSVDGAGRCTIGRWNAIGVDLRVLTSNHVTSTANMHGALHARLTPDEPGSIPGDVEIGSATWIGDRVTVLAGAHIGHGAVVGAGSLVRGVVVPFCVAVGVPARTIRRRFADDVCDALLELAWWDWPMGRLERNAVFFAADLTALSGDDVRALVVQ